MPQTKSLTRDGIFHLDAYGRYHYDSGLRPAYICCEGAREVARATAYALGAKVIMALTNGADYIYHVYTCTTAGTTHANVQPAGFLTGAGHRLPRSAITDGTAAFTFSHTPDQAFYVNGILNGRYVTVRNARLFDTNYLNGVLHKDDDFAYSEWTGSSGIFEVVTGSYYTNGRLVLTKEGGSFYTGFSGPQAAVDLISNEAILNSEGYIQD